MSRDGSDAFLHLADVLRGSLAESRAEVSERWPTEFDPMPAARDFVCATLVSIMGTTVPEDTEWSHGEVHRALIQTAVLQGMHATENCIIEGLYVQAAPLVRQEMEAVEALREIRQGLRLSGRTPRLRTLKHHGRIYSQMTELAHFSKCELLHHLLWDGSSVLVDPRFNRKFARFLFATHLNALVGIALDAANLFEKLRGKHLLEVEQEHLEIAMGILVEEGIVSLKSVEGKVE